MACGVRDILPAACPAAAVLHVLPLLPLHWTRPPPLALLSSHNQIHPEDCATYRLVGTGHCGRYVRPPPAYRSPRQAQAVSPAGGASRHSSMLAL